MLSVSSKFGTQETDRFSQSPTSNFELRYLNVLYMMYFMKIEDFLYNMADTFECTFNEGWRMVNAGLRDLVWNFETLLQKIQNPEPPGNSQKRDLETHHKYRSEISTLKEQFPRRSVF